MMNKLLQLNYRKGIGPLSKILNTPLNNGALISAYTQKCYPPCSACVRHGNGVTAWECK